MGVKRWRHGSLPSALDAQALGVQSESVRRGLGVATQYPWARGTSEAGKGFVPPESQRSRRIDRHEQTDNLQYILNSCVCLVFAGHCCVVPIQPRVVTIQQSLLETVP